MKTIRGTHILLVAALMLFCWTAAAYGDMGRVISQEVMVSEEGQKAIILHNFEEEVLILGTDLKADKKTGIIRFIPFPSEPKVRLASPKAFEAVSNLMKKHSIKFLMKTKGGSALEKDVELRFHKRMGAHDVTVVKVNDVSRFRTWVNRFFKEKGQPQKKAYPEIELIVEDYVRRGIVYFVFDFVEVTPETRLIEPISYRFKSRELYYPLKTTNTFGGMGVIDLILITPRTLCDPDPGQIFDCLGLYRALESTSAKIATEELRDVYPEADSFFGGLNIYIQLIKYGGRLHFEKDIFADVSKGIDRALSGQEDENILDRLFQRILPPGREPAAEPVRKNP